MDLIFSWLEWITVVLTLAYYFFLMRENIWCWPFGISSSATGVIVFYESQLYGQFILYIFFVLMSGYGWWYWYTGEQHNRPIKTWRPLHHAVAILCGVAASLISLFFLKKYFDSNSPELDITITVFSFIATFMEARKILSGWLYWIVLNALSIYLYWDNGLYPLSGLMVLYTVLSVTGYMAWRKSWIKTGRKLILS